MRDFLVIYVACYASNVVRQRDGALRCLALSAIICEKAA